MTDLFQRTIPEVLRRTARNSPDKDAFICGSERLTYSEVVEKSEQLATILVDLDVRKGDRVGVFLNQSLECAIAIYGIMMAGAAFVPIDPTTPSLRIKDVLGRCEVSVLVTNASKGDVIERVLADSDRDVSVIGVEQIDHPKVAKTVSWGQVFTAQIDALPDIHVQDLAYIMWTSGSTGAPKGLTHKHGNGLIYAGMLAETHGLTDEDRFLGLSPLHFDMCVMDYITAPLVGGTTIIVPEAVAKLPAALTRLAAQERATVWYSVPFSMTQMLERGAMDKHDLTALRWMIYGGEAFPLKHLMALQAALPDALFANAYGPAETHQVSSFTIGELTEESGPIPIGKPWRTLHALVLDEDDNQCPAGTIGELVVRSPSCMRGYWSDPEQTDASFYKRQISPGIDDFYYRTGDLVKMDEDGLMHFFGRKGRQVKVRGYRIELEAVEAALLAHENIAETAVVVSDNGLSLLAAVRCEGASEPSVEHVLQHCQGRLPVYAVPAVVQFVSDFPRTGSEKIDRKAVARKMQSEAPSSEDQSR